MPASQRRKWYDTLARALADLGFRVSSADSGVFHMKIKEHCLILAIHVDDCALTGSSSELIARYKEKINARYTLTDLGPIHWLLGFKKTRDRDTRTISLLLESFIDSILARFALQDVKSYATPMVPGVIYSRSDCPTSPAETDRVSKVPYREAIGSLMYASVSTRPDITFAVSTLSQFLDNPGDIHWEAVKRVLFYQSMLDCVPRDTTVCHVLLRCHCQITGARSYQVAWLHWAAATGKPHSHLNSTSSVNAAFFASTDDFDQFRFIHYHRQLFPQYLASLVDSRWYRGRAASQR